MTDTYLPSPSDRVADQVARYEATNGAEGGTLQGRPVIIMTTAVAGESWPHFLEYRARAGAREIPVLVLEPVEQS